MIENAEFKPVFRKIPKDVCNVLSVSSKNIGDIIFLFSPLVSAFGPIKERTVLICESRREENCPRCPVKDVCPRPYHAGVPKHRIPIHEEVAKQYWGDNPTSGNTTLTSGRPAPTNR